MKLVVDASVAVKWFVVEVPHEEHVEQARAVAKAVDQSGARLLAPPHWIAEVMAVLCRVDPGVVDGALETFAEIRPVIVFDYAIMKRASDLSIALNHHLFDTLYHAVALETGATLVTSDRRYFDKASCQGGIQLLEDFEATR